MYQRVNKSCSWEERKRNAVGEEERRRRASSVYKRAAIEEEEEAQNARIRRGSLVRFVWHFGSGAPSFLSPPPPLTRRLLFNRNLGSTGFLLPWRARLCTRGRSSPTTVVVVVARTSWKTINLLLLSSSSSRRRRCRNYKQNTVDCGRRGSSAAPKSQCHRLVTELSYPDATAAAVATFLGKSARVAPLRPHKDVDPTSPLGTSDPILSTEEGERDYVSHGQKQECRTWSKTRPIHFRVETHWMDVYISSKRKHQVHVP